MPSRRRTEIRAVELDPRAIGSTAWPRSRTPSPGSCPRAREEDRWISNPMCRSIGVMFLTHSGDLPQTRPDCPAGPAPCSPGRTEPSSTRTTSTISCASSSCPDTGGLGSVLRVLADVSLWIDDGGDTRVSGRSASGQWGSHPTPSEYPDRHQLPAGREGGLGPYDSEGARRLP